MTRRQSASLSWKYKPEVRSPHKALFIIRTWSLGGLHSSLAMINYFSLVLDSKKVLPTPDPQDSSPCVSARNRTNTMPFNGTNPE